MARLADIDVGGVYRLAKVLGGVADKKTAQVAQRSVGTLSRRLKAEAARKVSELQLNLSPSQIAPYISVKAGKAGSEHYVSVSAAKTRLPLTVFKPSFSDATGVRVQTWKDQPAEHLPHAFKRKGNQVWQRVPWSSGASSEPMTPFGLVQRLPIVQRKGPSLKRTLQVVKPGTRSHRREEVVEHLMKFGQSILAAEIKRLLAVTE